MAKERSPRIVFTDEATVQWGDLDLAPLKALGRYRGHRATPPRRLVARCQDADIVITNKSRFTDASVFKALPRLRLLCVAATGVNNVDLDLAARFGVAVCNVGDYATASVAEHALLFILAAARSLETTRAAVRNGAWSRSPIFCVNRTPFAEIRGKTLGIVGYGRIGKALARRARALGMKILAAASPGKTYGTGVSRRPLETILGVCDFISLHCPLTPATKDLIGAKQIALMRKNAWLINTARGPLVDEQALVRALARNRIAGYAADVLAEEPPRRIHPLLSRALAGKTLLTPHIAWAAFEARRKLIGEIAKNIAAHQNGRRRNRIV